MRKAVADSAQLPKTSEDIYSPSSQPTYAIIGGKKVIAIPPWIKDFGNKALPDHLTV
jgi:hypothetical protein